MSSVVPRVGLNLGEGSTATRVHPPSLLQKGQRRFIAPMVSAHVASQEELKAAKVPVAWRDQCSALLIPLNACRRKNYYLPWECENERHGYEKCQYDDMMRRMKKMSKLKAQQAEELEG